MSFRTTMQVMGFVMVVGFAPVSAQSLDVAQFGAEASRGVADRTLAGSWLVTYDVPAFGPPFVLLLSLAEGSVAIETDAPGVFPLGPGVSVILSNGHGAWAEKPSNGAFTYLYRKLIFQQDGLTPFGLSKTRASGKVQSNGKSFRAQIVIELADLTGQVFFETTGTATATRISAGD